MLTQMSGKAIPIAPDAYSSLTRICRISWEDLQRLSTMFIALTRIQ